MVKLNESEVYDLLGKLCVELGFCLRPTVIARFQKNPPMDIDSFTEAVFVAEELDPSANLRLREQVREIVREAFDRAAPN